MSTQNPRLNPLLIALLAGLALWTTGCIEPIDAEANQDGGSEADGGGHADGGAPGDAGPEVRPVINPVVEPNAQVTLTFISGHLGNYWDCPGEALASQERRAGEPSGGAFAGDCAEDSEDCGGLWNCDSAMVIFQVENNGPAAIEALSVHELAILLDPAVISEVLSVTRADTDPETGGEVGGPPGRLAPGETTRLRVNFRGPAQDGGGWDEVFPVEIQLDADGTPATLLTPGLSRLAAVAT